ASTLAAAKAAQAGGGAASGGETASTPKPGETGHDSEAERRAQLTLLADLMTSSGLAGEPAPAVLAVLGHLARSSPRSRPVKLGSLGDLTDAQLAQVTRELELAIGRAGDAGEPVVAALLNAAGWQPQGGGPS